MTIKKTYMSKANYLMEMLDEAGVDDTVATPGPGGIAPGQVAPGGEDAEEDPEGDQPADDDTEKTEKGQAEQVKVFFSDLQEKTQKVLMDALKEALNATEDDEYAEEKIIDALKKEPIVTFQVEELVRQLNIEI